VPGGEVAGTVVAVGAGVETPVVGTRVFALAGDDGLGGYAQFALAWAQTAIPVPDGVSSEVASVLTVAGATAKVMLAHAARLEAGETVLIPAATGGVGSFALQIARQRKAGKIVAAVGSPEKRARALSMGADEVVVEPFSLALASWSPDHHPAFRSRTGTVVLDSKHGIDDFYHFPHDESLTPTIWRAEPHDDKTSLSIYSLADSGDTLPSKHKWWGMSSRGKSHPSVIKEMVKTIRDHRPGSTIVGERSTGWSGGTRA
jgi:hypothetical protein